MIGGWWPQYRYWVPNHHAMATSMRYGIKDQIDNDQNGPSDTVRKLFSKQVQREAGPVPSHWNHPTLDSVGTGDSPIGTED